MPKKNKAPWLPWYVKDWLSDECVRQLSPADRGHWLDCLCHMWMAEKRGELDLPLSSLANLLHMSHPECIAFVTALFETKTADVFVYSGVTWHTLGTPDHNPITLGSHTRIRVENRRLVRERKAKEYNIERKGRSLSYKNAMEVVTPDDHTGITPLSAVAVALTEDKASVSGDLLMLIPCRAGRKGDPSHWPVVREFIEEFEKIYPAMDVFGEVQRSAAWQKADPPARMKTYRGMRAHLTGWFSRGHDKGTFMQKGGAAGASGVREFPGFDEWRSPTREEVDEMRRFHQEREEERKALGIKPMKRPNDQV